MKQFCRILAALALAGGLLALINRLCRRRRQRAQDAYLTLYSSDE